MTKPATVRSPLSVRVSPLSVRVSPLSVRVSPLSVYRSCRRCFRLLLVLQRACLLSARRESRMRQPCPSGISSPVWNQALWPRHVICLHHLTTRRPAAGSDGHGACGVATWDTVLAVWLPGTRCLRCGYLGHGACRVATWDTVLAVWLPGTRC